MPQSVTFFGAAETVTGSRHLLSIGKHRVLVDCGLFQGLPELKERNWAPFPVEPSSIDAVIVTHAHTDHIGYLPRLVAQGFRGPIYATPSTIGISRISLPDGGRIQEEEARYRNEHGITRHTPALPLYTEADAYASLKRFKPAHCYQWIELPGGATFRFLNAGHILGSSFAEIYFENGERILFTGDLGRYDRPIIKDPTPIEHAEYLVLESTYGDRLHSNEDPLPALERIFAQAVRDRSCVLVPSFAIGRTQELLWYIHELQEQGRMPRIPVYVDSPMASAATLLYTQHEEDFDTEMKLDMSDGRSPLSPDLVRFVRDRNASIALNDMTGPMVIISGSGMLSGGRIVHHLKRRLPDESTILLFTGYQAEGTKGREIIEGADTVYIHKQPVRVRAQVERLDMLSAHADYAETLCWLESFKEPPRQTWLVHGEPPAQRSLKEKIEERFGWPVAIAKQGQTVKL